MSVYFINEITRAASYTNGYLCIIRRLRRKAQKKAWGCLEKE